MTGKGRRNRTSAEKSAARKRRLAREAVEARSKSTLAYSTRSDPQPPKQR